MLKILCRYIISILVLTIGIVLIPTSWCDIHCLFKSTLRSTFFSSFLTMGSFTLSLMTMFMFSLKDKLFDDKKYVEDIEKTSKELGQKINRYNSLVMISQLFLFCVFCCFITSLFQVSIGLVDNKAASALCIALALSTIGLALFILIKVWKNLKIWFNILMDQGNQ